MRVPAKSAWQGSEHLLQVHVVSRAMLLASTYRAVRMLHAIPSGDWRGFAVGKKLKAEGVVPGVPDLCLPVPVGDYHGLYLELKRKGKSPSEEQWKFMINLYALGYCVHVTNHLEVALEIIEDYLKGNSTKHGA